MRHAAGSYEGLPCNHRRARSMRPRARRAAAEVERGAEALQRERGSAAEAHAHADAARKALQRLKAAALLPHVPSWCLP